MPVASPFGLLSLAWTNICLTRVLPYPNSKAVLIRQFGESCFAANVRLSTPNYRLRG